MSMISDLLEEEIKSQIPDKEVAILLSGGVDSLSLAFACHRLGKKINAYNFHLDGNISYDTRKANIVCKIFNWKIHNIIVPKINLERDFLILAKKFNCKKKTQFECTFPFLYVYPKIKEKYILSGILADGLYGVSKKAMINFKEPKELFDKFRIDYFNNTNPAGLLQQFLLAKKYNKIFIYPYNTKKIKDFFMQFSHKELHNGKQKIHVRSAYKEEFKKIGSVKNHLNLQLDAGIDTLFEELLKNQAINFKNRIRVMDICKDWSLHG